MALYLLEIKRGYPKKVQMATMNVNGMDALRRHAIREFLTKEGKISVWKLNRDGSKKLMGIVMYSSFAERPVWGTRKESTRNNTTYVKLILHNIDPGTGKIGKGW